MPPRTPATEQDVAVQFIMSVWLREWATDLDVLRLREPETSMRHQFLHGMVMALTDAAWEIANGSFEPGGDAYERFAHATITEP